MQDAPRRRAAMLLFLTLAFSLPWLAWTVLGRFGWDRPWSMPLFVLGGAFCSIGGIAATCLRHGTREGLHRLAAMLRPRRALLPWLCALLWAPLWELLASLLFSQATGAVIRWEPAGLLRFASGGILFLWLTGPLGEEFGWRGFLWTELRARWPAWRAVLILGPVWAFWHLPLMLGRWSQDPLHALFFLVMVSGFALLIGAVFEAGGLLPAMLLHWTINASQEVMPHVATGLPERGHLYLLCMGAAMLTVSLPGLYLLRRASRAMP
nr:type II CAAX endopeptidase family protein [Massilia sp. TS11]